MMHPDAYERALRARADRRRRTLMETARDVTARADVEVAVVIDTFGASAAADGDARGRAATAATATARERTTLEAYDDARAPRDFDALRRGRVGAVVTVRGAKTRRRAAEDARRAARRADERKLRVDACATCGVRETTQWRMLPMRFAPRDASGGSAVCNKCYAKARRTWTVERRAREEIDGHDDDDAT